jgi:hypothetical protein
MTRIKRVDGWWKSTGYSMNSPMSCKHEYTVMLTVFRVMDE